MPNKESSNSYQTMIDLLHEMDDTVKLAKDMLVSELDQYNLSFEVVQNLLKIPYNVLNKENPDQVEEALSIIIAASTDEGAAVKEEIADTLVSLKAEEETKDATEFDAKLTVVRQIKESARTYLELETEAKELKDEAADNMKDYFDYLSSPELEKRKAKRLALLKEQIKDAEDGYEKRKMEDMIKAMENTITFAFMYDDLEKEGKKEIQRIEDGFFKERIGSYTIDRYKAKIKRFGFDPKLYRYFFNLEERFLPEEYHPFNNLFLFIYMRFTAHADPYTNREKMYVQALTTTMAKLIYHKFASTDTENTFLEVVKKVLDYFKDDVDVFKEKNTTHPTHPTRIAADQKYEADRKAALLEKIKQMGMEGYDENWTAKQLHQFFNEKMEEMVKNDSNTSENVEVTEEADGSVTIAPMPLEEQEETEIEDVEHGEVEPENELDEDEVPEEDEHHELDGLSEESDTNPHYVPSSTPEFLD